MKLYLPLPNPLLKERAYSYLWATWFDLNHLMMANKRENKTPLSRGRGAGGEGEKSNKSIKLSLHAGAEPYQFRYAKELRREMTKAEEVLWEQLRARRFLNLKFRRQHPILDFVVDFYCHELKLIVEADGKYHSEENTQYYDDERTKELQRYGYLVIRFSNEEILNDMDQVLRQLKKKVKIRKTLP
ncbi:MAG: endonuclease domain-containing protein [Balneolaceae bacterium]|nr:endonuclease domain-containing protein [Balneolaceae bacterium]